MALAEMINPGVAAAGTTRLRSALAVLLPEVPVIVSG